MLTTQNEIFCVPLYFQPISNADFIVPVEIDGTVHQVYVLKRPFVDEFLKKMGELFECVLFTASLAKVILQIPYLFGYKTGLSRRTTNN